MAKTFRKRTGTTNKGGDYEILNIANISMQLVIDETVQNFWISSNDQDFGAFDDIVVETAMENGTESIYAIQTKHIDRGNLSQKHLTQPKGDFSIKKYFDSVQTLKVPETKFILYTNLKFNVPLNTKFCLDGENFQIIATKIYPKFSFKISYKTDYCYRFSVVKDGNCENSSTVSLYEKFFDSFFLYADQNNVHNLERNIVKNFQTSFCGNEAECDQYIHFLNKWGLEDGKKEKLDKKWIKLAIALNIFSSRIKPLSFNDSNDSSSNGSKIIKRNILREAIGAFEVTIFQKESYDEVKQLWADGKCELKDLETVNKLRKKYQLASTYISHINEVDSLTLSKLLWLLGKCPLILTQNESIEKAVDLCAGEKCILLKDDSQNSFKSGASVFKTLQDLKAKTSLYDQLVKNFTCSLQGKEEIRLEHLIKVDETIVTVLKTDDLLEMLQSPCGFGISQKKLPKSYIQRTVLKNAIDFKFLDNVTKETIIILDCVPQNNYLKTRLKNHTLIDINVEKGKTQILNIEDRNDKKSHMAVSSLNTTIYLSEKRCNYDEFNAIYNETRNAENLHQFRVRGDGNLEWIRTKGDVSNIEKYKFSRYYDVREQHMDSLEFENNINLLISDPGMGKSELMESFKSKCFREYFTVSVDPKDVYLFLQSTRDGYNYVDSFQKFLLDEKYKWLSDRDKDVLRLLLKKNQIIYVWDALDELSDKHRDIVTDIIVELSKNCVQWVTSRYHLQNMLQKKFNVLSLDLNKFTENEQMNYIQERLSDDETTKEQIRVITHKIKSSFALVEHKDILGIPLQLFMLTELFRQDRQKYSALLNDFFLLTDLYKYFIEEKINILYREKHVIDLKTSYTESLIQNQKVKILEEYTNAALKLLFPDTIFRKLAVQNEDIFRTIHQSQNNIGLVTETRDQIPRFLHNSFAEYLAARYFVSNLEHGEIQTQDLFDPRYTNVRFFFDLLLTGGSQTHIAVLYKNFSFVKRCNSDILTNTDRGGRSVLHLACSWGERYPELNVKYVGDNYIVEDDGHFVIVPDKPEYFKTIDYLLEKCDISESDEIYKMTAKEYARKARCRGAEMRIRMKATTLNLKSTEIDHIIKLLYYSAHYGYHYEFAFFYNELSIQVERNFVKQENNTTRRKLLSSAIVTNIKNSAGMTLLYRAAQNGSVQIVDFLLKAGANINAALKDGTTPLCTASLNDNHEIVELLLEAGADINAGFNDDATPFHMVSLTGNNKIAELLLKAGVDIDFPTKNGWTPLIIASQSGNDKIVESLLKVGAHINAASKDGVTPLLIASQDGNDNIVEILLKAGADVNAANKYGVTPLYIASQVGNDNIVEILLKAGADVNAASRQGETPLYVASHKGNDKAVEFLLKAGADTNLLTKNGVTPLTLASHNGNDKIVELLLKAGADTNPLTKDGWTPLTLASHNGNDKIVELLLKVGVDINLPTKNGSTPLSIASQNGNVKAVEILLKAGADINATNNNGATPLYIASQNGHDKIVEFLLKAGANINAANKDGVTPLYIVSQNGNDKTVELLLKAGAGVNVAKEGDATPLFIASQNGNDEIVELLLKAGADINLPTISGFTPLNVASQVGNDNIVEILLKAGADVNAANNDGATPLYIASQKGNDKIVEFLLKAGADTNLPTKDGVTPLFIASQNGNDKTVELLLKAGADANAADKDGVTPLYIASQVGNDNIVEILLKAGADVNAASRQGEAPLHVASEKVNDTIIEFLLKAGADTNLPTKDGATPLYIASQNGNDKTVELLLKAGADANAAIKDGVTALCIASHVGNDNIVEILLKAGADANAADKDGVTSLYIASEVGNDNLVEILLKAGADVNAASRQGVAPLHVASYKGNDTISELLLKAGADTNLPTKDGVTPLYMASQNGNDKIVESLVKFGADINLRTKAGGSPFDIALQQKHAGIVTFLKECGAI